MLVGPLDEAVNVRALVGSDYGGARLHPILLDDGRYALPEQVLTIDAYQDAHAILDEWDTETITTADYEPTPTGSGSQRMLFAIGDGRYFHVGRRASLTMPDTDVFRFELQPNDFGGEFDWGWGGSSEDPADSSDRNKRRSTLVSYSEGIEFTDEETAWVSFCLILGDTPGFATAEWATIMSFGSTEGADVSGVFSITLPGGDFIIRTRSSADTWSSGSGKPISHYTGTAPAKGVKTYIVLQITFGEEGHLNAWVNGSQVVDEDTPIGYYALPHTYLGRPQFGVYENNQSSTDVVYIANMEIGSADLSDRIASPLSVPDLTW